MSSIDPKGWVQNPPSVFVKVQGVTSRATLNGKYGLIMQYVSEKQRYTVVLCESQEIVSLKVENLQVCTFLEKFPAYTQMIRHNPDIQRQYQKVTQQVQQRLPKGMKLSYALVLLLVGLVFLWYMMGWSKLLLLGTVGIMIMTMIGPDLMEGKDLRSIVRSAPLRYRDLVRTQIPYVGPTLASRSSYLMIITVVFLTLLLYSFLGTPTNSMFWNHRRRAASTTRSMSTTRSIPHPYHHTNDVVTTTSVSSRQLLDTDNDARAVPPPEYYYQLGFDDATKGSDFGTSLPKKVKAAKEDVILNDDGTTTDIDEEEEEDPYAWSSSTGRRSDTTTRGQKAKTTPFSISTIMAMFTIYRIVQPLAYNTNTGQYDWQLLLANVQHLDMWKYGILAFAFYRIVASFL
jgi:uncharacterized protein YlbG (UPF0298 family)